jgi:hypothetical protein
MLRGALQAVPSNVTAFPAASTATQNDAEGHDTELSAVAASMLRGALQAVPLKVTAFPAESTAAQNETDGQETDTNGAESTCMGADQWAEARAIDGAITSVMAAKSATRATYRRGCPGAPGEAQRWIETLRTTA